MYIYIYIYIHIYIYIYIYIYGVSLDCVLPQKVPEVSGDFRRCL